MATPASALRVYYGGTFDPVHLGHLGIARTARDVLQASVRLLPAADPPHRSVPGASAEQRAKMLELAVKDDVGLLVDRREFARVGPSYTVETLELIRAEIGPNTPLALLVGADSFDGLIKWHRWQDLLTLAHLVVAARIGSSLETGLSAPLVRATTGRWVDRPDALHERSAGRLLRLAQTCQPESATEVRSRIAAGDNWGALLPPAVAQFIRMNCLYGAGPL